MKKLFTTCCALLLAAPTFAQKDEFGAWLEVEGEKKITKRIDLSLGLGMRANDNLGEVSRANAFIGGSYKACDYLKVAATYQYISDLSRGEVKEDFKKNSGKFRGKWQICAVGKTVTWFCWQVIFLTEKPLRRLWRF